MNEPAAQFETSAGQVEELQDEVQSLRMLLYISLILMMVFGACMDFFLLKQVSDLRSATGKAAQLWEKVDVTKAVDFWTKLNEYAKTHPELSPLMDAARPFASQTLLNPAYTPKKN